MQSSNKNIITSKENQLLTLSQETANKIERFLFERYGDIQVMSKLPFLKTLNKNDLKVKEYFESVRKAYNTYDYICVVNKTGTVLTSSGIIANDSDWKIGLRRILKGEVYNSGFVKNKNTNDYVVYFAAPIFSDDNKVIGAVIERMGFDSINQIVKNVKIGDSGRAYLFNSNINIKEKVDYKDNYVFAYTKLEIVGESKETQVKYWYLVIEEPENEAFQASIDYRNYLFFVLFISITAALILAYFISRSIASPIKKLAKDTRNLAETGISEDIKIIGNDEISSVAESFNILMGNMRDFSAGMAHEIKNPLASIKGYAQYVKSEMKENNPLIEDMNIISTEVDRLNNILDRFLNFAKPNLPVLKPCDINETLNKIIELYSNEKTKLIKNYANLQRIMIDQEQISQVLANVILNSIQAMPLGGNLEILTKKSEEAQQLVIMIKDSGIGMSNETKTKIFDPFFTTKDKGTGLGLAIGKRIIENHSGTIDVFSEIGKGTAFVIKLPL